MERPPADARDERDARAAEWAAQLATGPLPAAREAELRAWLDTDTRHRGALIRAQAALAALAQSPAQAVAAAPPRRTLGRRALLAGGAACALAGLGLALRPAPSLATGIGEIRQTPLDDGSSVVLDTATCVTPRFSAAARDIRLDRGRALFRVAHDPARPFVVEAAGIRIRAVGTAFSVAQDDDVEVLVTEGVVEVTGALRPARLRAGERGRFRVGDAAATDLLSADAMARALDWRDGRLELQGQTLASAVAAINRYNRRPIVVADAALARQPLHGAFRNDDPEGFARTVALALGTRSRVENDRIVIGR
ncbi:iron dicitrate transport regulator FecR [Sphingomonas ginsenosidimutans]|uniref:Iron dicitrate transport regulator FecR n=2 Tax=Sphingomonas ginsenosidimutans TaxID=862134 RepID=A0A2A4HVF0_9SPHN|nr:FecR domain-containing protein [Sphingomonas ginsenosidimutans]PCG08506.1 iron dicitrate transport regulator FecR [Sphingomonas ginsenosidimutans]